MNKIDRFAKRKKIRQDIESKNGLSIVADRNLVEEFLNSDIDFDAIQTIHDDFDKVYDFKFNIDVSDQEADELLKIMENDFNDQKFKGLLTSCKNDILSSVIGPFGLGGLVAKADIDGGNVTTTNNAREKVYARKQDEYKREEYTNSRNSEGKVFAGGGKNSVGSDFTRSQLDQNNNLTDAYTGKRELASTTSPDHIVANSDFHKDGGFMLSSEKKADFATDTDNLASTRRDINQSMSDQDKKKWLDAKQNDRDITNAEHFGIDRELVNERHQKGRATAEKHAPSTADKTKYYSERIAETGFTEGSEMGSQQALGLVFCEFFSATFDEIEDIYKNGFSNEFENDLFFPILKKRLSRIAMRIASRWKDACKAFAGGFLSGFLSNLVTVVINMFSRLGKRMVRIIREGFFSILKAIKMICFPPKGMTFAQAAHEASKLIAAGLTVVGGIALEQHIDNMIKAAPLVEPFADIITTVLVGGLTGIATIFIVYAIDKIDVFNVNDNAKHTYIMDKLETNLERMFSKGSDLIEELSYCG